MAGQLFFLYLSSEYCSFNKQFLLLAPNRDATVLGTLFVYLTSIQACFHYPPPQAACKDTMTYRILHPNRPLDSLPNFPRGLNAS